MLLPKIRQFSLSGKVTVNELVRHWEATSVMGGGALARCVAILEAMIRDRQCTVFFGQAGALVPGGMRGILIDMLERGWIDVFVATGATFTHDLGEALGYSHYQGSAYADDAKLQKLGYDRMYDSYMPNTIYEGLEDFFKKNWEQLSTQDSIKDFLWKIGELTPHKSLLKVCHEKRIPVFCPAIADSGIGLMMWGRLAEGKAAKVKAFEDLRDIMDIAWNVKKAGVFYLGGGVPKNFIQQAMQLAPKSAGYGVQITMDRPEPGGSSGAELKEGISWGKMHPRATHQNLICDVTIALPIMYAALVERLS